MDMEDVFSFWLSLELLLHPGHS